MIDNIEQEVARLKAIITELYQSDSMPWIIGYSGGKDSTTCVQLVWMAISELPEEKRSKPVHVISTDTLVENPVVAAWVSKSLEKMEKTAIENKLPIFPHRLTPELKNRFWVNLIGRGYPAPRPKFRWCTERLKILTATSFLQNLSETNGEAILVLGTRKAESHARAHTIEKYEGSSRKYLSRNADPKLSRVWVFSPIVDWTNDDVWEFIGTFENPWGVASSDLLELYRGATPDHECPVVVDTSTQSCGDSRFGCYVCTMVAQDKSMEAMILNDESKAWMQPILDFRNKYLAPDEKERSKRDFKRLGNNRLILIKNELVHGPYTQSYRAELLRHLLIAQVEVKRDGEKSGFKNVDLIGMDELDEIRRIWVEEKGEIEDLLPKIYADVMGKPYPGKERETLPVTSEDLELLSSAAKEWISSNIPGSEDEVKGRSEELYELVRTLLASSYHSKGSKQRSKQLDEIGKILDRYAFLDEAQATQFARTYVSNSSDDASEPPVPDTGTDEKSSLTEEDSDIVKKELLI